MDKRFVVLDPEKVIRLRHGKSWGQGQLARKAGCSKRTIERIERGKRTSIRISHEIAQALGVAPTELMTMPGALPPQVSEQTIQGLLSSQADRELRKVPHYHEVRCQLPPPLGDFVGREDEIAELVQRLRSGGRVCISGIQ